MPNILVNLLEVCGGLGLFFLGMKFMGDGLELAAGSRLRILLEKITSNTYLGMLVGLVVTAVIQSSSATAAMVVGFTNAGLMELAQTAGILFGSKIGTCMTSVLLSIDIGAIIPIVILGGVLVMMFSKKNNAKHIAMIFAGFGILFYGMMVMSGSLKAINEIPAPNGMGVIDNLLLSINSPWVGLLIGTVITAIIQSSSASVGILMALAVATQMDINQAIFIVYGMNLGACVPAFLSAVGTKRQAKQVAILNLLITLFGVILLFPLTMLLPFGDWIKAIAPDNYGVQVSIAHIFFNVANMAVLMPFSKLMVRLTQKMLPVEEEEREDKMKPEFLDDLLLSAPPMAVLQCEKEVERLTRLVDKNYKRAIEVFFEYDATKAAKIFSREKTIDYLCKCITDYIVKINGLDIQDNDRYVVAAMYSAIQDLERIGDYAENIAEFAEQYKERKHPFSDTALHELRHMCELTAKLVDMSFNMFINQKGTPQEIQDVVMLEDEIDDCKDIYKEAHIKRINSGQCGAEKGALFLNMLTDLERVGDHAIDVAFVIPNRNKKMQASQANA